MYRGPIHQIHQDTSRNVIHQKRYIYRGALLLERMPSCCLTTHKSCWQVNGLALGVSGSPFVHQPSAAAQQKHRSAAPRQDGSQHSSCCGLPCFRHSTVWPLSALHILTCTTAPPHAPLSPKRMPLPMVQIFLVLATVQLRSHHHRCGGADRYPAIQNPVVTQCHDPMLNNL